VAIRVCAAVRDQRDQEQHDEDDEQHLGDFRGAGSEAGEPKTAAMMAMMKKASAQLSMTNS